MIISLSVLIVGIAIVIFNISDYYFRKLDNKTLKIHDELSKTHECIIKEIKNTLNTEFELKSEVILTYPTNIYPNGDKSSKL